MAEIDDALNPVLAAFKTRLEATLLNHAVIAYLKGSAQMISFGRTLTDKPILYEGPPMQQAINFAQKKAARLVTEMDIETKDKLAQIISNGIKNKRGVDGLARDIRKEFIDMSKARSQLISKTETRDSLFHASQERMEDIGVTGKQWILGSGGQTGNCPNCRANANAGIIPVGEEFPTPQYEIHPGCTCAIAPAMLRR